jgi:hypothetical protein
MPAFLDLTSQTFAFLRVLSQAESRRNPGGKLVTHWLCRCTRCGTEKVIAGNSLRMGLTKSCGCYQVEAVTKANTKHGDYQDPLYNSFNMMWQRCTNRSRPEWKRYGGRGITVCNRWQDYANFKADMGPTYQVGMTLDRINNDGNYEPSNCRWATRKMQQRNRWTGHWITLDGETKRVSEWAEKVGLDFHVIAKRLRRGWTEREAVFGKTEAPQAVEPSVQHRSPIELTHDGKTMRLHEWAKELGIDYETLYARHRRGWPVEKLLRGHLDQRGSY